MALACTVSSLYAAEIIVAIYSQSFSPNLSWNLTCLFLKGSQNFNSRVDGKDVVVYILENCYWHIWEGWETSVKDVNASTAVNSQRIKNTAAVNCWEKLLIGTKEIIEYSRIPNLIW